MNPIRYRSYYYDSETGFYYLDSRYYDPETGRFLSEDDPKYLETKNVNSYAYCENNPVNMVDFDGHLAQVLGGITFTTPQGIAVVLAITALMVLFPPAKKQMVNDAVAWAVRNVVRSVESILAKFKKIGMMIAKKIVELVDCYQNQILEASVPNSLKNSDGKVDISKFNTPGQMPGKGPRGQKGPKGWQIVRIFAGKDHRGDAWKLYNPSGEIIAVLKEDDTIVKWY